MASGLIGLFALGLEHSTIRVAAAAVPDRLSLLLAKRTVACGWAGGATALTLLMGWLVSRTFTPLSPGPPLLPVAGCLLAYVLRFVVVGVGLAAPLMSQRWAVYLMFFWVGLLEPATIGLTSVAAVTGHQGFTRLVNYLPESAGRLSLQGAVRRIRLPGVFDGTTGLGCLSVLVGAGLVVLLLGAVRFSRASL